MTLIASFLIILAISGIFYAAMAWGLKQIPAPREAADALPSDGATESVGQPNILQALSHALLEKGTSWGLFACFAVAAGSLVSGAIYISRAGVSASGFVTVVGFAIVAAVWMFYGFLMYVYVTSPDRSYAAKVCAAYAALCLLLGLSMDVFTMRFEPRSQAVLLLAFDVAREAVTAPRLDGL